MKIDKNDKLLIKIATEKAKEINFDNSPFDTHICAIKTTTGEVFFGMNLAHWFGPCAEQVALSNVFLANKKPVTCVCVRNEDGVFKIASPCGNCLQLFSRHCPYIKCVISNDDKHTISELLPFGYK